MSNFNEMFTGTNPVKNERTKEDIDAYVAESKENRQKCYQMADEMALKIANDPAYFKQYLDMQGAFPATLSIMYCCWQNRCQQPQRLVNCVIGENRMFISKIRNSINHY